MNFVFVAVVAVYFIWTAWRITRRVMDKRRKQEALRRDVVEWGIRLPREPWERVAVASHKRPDYDAWGSAVGLARILSHMGYAVDLYMDNAKPAAGVVQMLEDLKVTVRNGKTFRWQDYSRVFVTDCGDPTRMCIDLRGCDRVKVDVISIDHHGNAPVGDYELVDKSAASASELVWLWMMVAERHLKADLRSHSIAEALLLGHLGDTLGLSIAGSVAMDTAADLAACAGDKGVRRAWSWYSTRTASELAIRAYAESQAACSVGDVISYAIEQKDFAAYGGKTGLSGLAGDLLKVKGFRYAVTATPDKESGPFDRWRISVRSAEGAVPNAQHIARQFNGDGHPDAAGCEVMCSDARTAIEAVNMVKAYIATCRFDDPLE